MMYQQKNCFDKSVEATIDFVEIDCSQLNGQKAIFARQIRRLCEEALIDAGYLLKKIVLKKASVRSDYALAYKSMGYHQPFLHNEMLLWLFELEENGLPFIGILQPFGEEKLWIFPRVVVERTKCGFLRLLTERHGHISADVRVVFTNYLAVWHKSLRLVCGYVETRDCSESAQLSRNGKEPVMWRKFRWYLF